MVGIDLGTTNSLIGYFGENGPKLIKNALGEFLTPSVVGVDDSGVVLIGQSAKDRLITHPESTIANFKRWMGSDRKTKLGSQIFRPEELSAMVLRSLVMDAEHELGRPVTNAVVSVPAYFSDAQRKATRTAGTLAGLNVELIINEPTAAALAYGVERRAAEGKFLIFDLGGGTLDVSIVEMFDGVFEVHASAGDNLLGGEDFLDVLVNAWAEDHDVKFDNLNLSEQAQLRRNLEWMKVQLSFHSEVERTFGYSDREKPWTMSQDRYGRLCETLLQRIRMPLERAIRDAKLEPLELDEIILVGGASRIPLVINSVSRMLGRLPLRHVQPDQAIALGAAVAAGIRGRNEKLEELILTDVCPYSLGISVSRADLKNGTKSGYFHPIISRNTTVPVSKEDVFFPVLDYQETIKINVFQGESPWIKNNIKLGELDVPLDAKKLSESKGILVRFTYDVDGLLQVEVKNPDEKGSRELIIQQGDKSMSKEEVQVRLKMLSSLKIHPRDRQENIALLARAERVYIEYIRNRPDVQNWISDYQSALETQDLKLIERGRSELSILLDRVEGL